MDGADVVTPGPPRPPDPIHIRKNTQKSKFLLAQTFKWKKIMFFVIPDIPSKTCLLWFLKKFLITLSISKADLQYSHIYLSSYLQTRLLFNVSIYNFVYCQYFAFTSSDRLTNTPYSPISLTWTKMRSSVLSFLLDESVLCANCESTGYLFYEKHCIDHG